MQRGMCESEVACAFMCFCVQRERERERESEREGEMYVRVRQSLARVSRHLGCPCSSGSRGRAKVALVRLAAPPAADLQLPIRHASLSQPCRAADPQAMARNARA